MNKRIAVTGSFFVLIGIILGAFGAHALKEVINSEQLVSFETGVRYMIYHGLALFILGLSSDKIAVNKWISRLMIAGVLIFSGSIFLLSLQSALGLNLKFLGPITPLGGLLMIVSWVLVILTILKSSVKS